MFSKLKGFTYLSPFTQSFLNVVRHYTYLQIDIYLNQSIQSRQIINFNVLPKETRPNEKREKAEHLP